MAAFDAALHEGADGIEFDLQLCADGIPVVFHDHTLAKLGRPRACVSDFSLDELQTMDAGRWFGATPARIPTLDEVLQAYAGETRLYIELKKVGRKPVQQQLVQAVVNRIKRCVNPYEIFILSFSGRLLNAVLDDFPQAQCVRSADTRWALPLVRRQLRHLSGVCVNIDAFGSAATDTLAALKKPLMAYTCNHSEQLRQALKLEVRHIITDYPQRSIAWLRENA